MQEFNITKKYVYLMRVCLLGHFAFLAFGSALPFLPNHGNNNTQGIMGISLISILFFGFFTILTLIALKKLPYANVVTDHDGLWLKHIPRERGLVQWEAVSTLKERAFMQCLDVFDVHDQRLIRVNYQVSEFNILRELLCDAMIRNSNLSTTQTSFTKGFAYHLFSSAAVIGFSVLGWYVGANVNPVLGYVGVSVMVVLMIYEYFTTIWKVHINGSKLNIYYPFSCQSISFVDILSIDVANASSNGAQHPEVWLLVRNEEKPFKLTRLGVDANTLFSALKIAKSQH